MVPDNATIVATHLDWLRNKQPKFICLNDDMKGEQENKTVEESGLKEMKTSQQQQKVAGESIPDSESTTATSALPSAVELLHRFYTSYLPTPCPFELPTEVINDHLYVDDYFEKGSIPSALRVNYQKWKQLRNDDTTAETNGIFNQLFLTIQQQPARATTIVAIMLLVLGVIVFYCLSVWFGRSRSHRLQFPSVLSSSRSFSNRSTMLSTTTSRFARRDKGGTQEIHV